MLIIHLVITFVFLILGFFFSRGKGTFLIAGYNTASKERKQKIDKKKLSRFTGNLMFISAGCWFIIALSDIMKSMIIHVVGLGLFLVMVIVAVVYANTGNRFER